MEYNLTVNLNAFLFYFIFFYQTRLNDTEEALDFQLLKFTVKPRSQH